MLAQVATETQPRYSPKVPSTTIRSTVPGPPEASEETRTSRWASRPSTSASARITATLAQTEPVWVTSSQAALSSIESAASQPVARSRGSVARPGSHCQTV